MRRKKVKRIIAFSLCLIGVVACGSLKNKFAVERVATISGQRYIGELSGKRYLSLLAPKGNWHYRQLSTKRNPFVMFFGNTTYSGTSVNFRSSIGASSFIYNDSNKLIFPNGKKAGKILTSFYNTRKHVLETGDYQGGLDRYYQDYYNPKHNKEVGLGQVIPSLIKINEYTCWKYNETQSFGPDINGDWGDNYVTRLSVFIHCPVLIDGKVGQLGVSYGMNINVKQFRAAYGNNGPTAEQLMAELTAQIKPSIESLQIHLPNVSQPRPKNDDAHKDIKRFGE